MGNDRDVDAIFQVAWLLFAPMCTDQYVCEWLYYNFVAERFTQKHFAAQCIPLKMIFISQQKNLIHAPFVGLTGNVRSPQVQLV